jgi:hypothetical protein
VLTVDDLLAALGIPPDGATNEAWAQQAVDAVNAYVARLPHVIKAGGAWTDDTKTGASMLAQRIYEARSAPLGAAGIDVTGALMRSTTDPEVGRLLRIGRYQTPRAG